ncbi:DUF3944 domain-containing protein [Salmonella sp. WGH-01]|nr:DUF3944 domain-containing protein [Salmonella sp. WGH-01]
MNVTYLHDEDLDFLQHCSEEQLADFARLLTHNERAKLACRASLVITSCSKRWKVTRSNTAVTGSSLPASFSITAATVSPTNCADTENSTARFCWMSQNG